MSQLALFDALEYDDPGDSVYCLDCDTDTIKIGEYYFLRNDVWLLANPAGDGMLCIGCLEQRLGRSLGRPNFRNPTCIEEGAKSRRLLQKLRAPRQPDQSAHGPRLAKGTPIPQASPLDLAERTHGE